MTKYSVAILGANGMLGSMVLKVFSKEKDIVIVAAVRSQKEKKELQKKYPGLKIKILDVETASEKDIFKVIATSDWIINCIGLIKPYIHDGNAVETLRAIRINALYPHLLAQAAFQAKAKVLQIETDCVYSGKKGGYKENDDYDPMDVYGKTKSLGEVNLPHVFHLRDSIIGPELNAHLSLMDWFLTQKKGATVSGFTNHYWNGLTTYHFAKICLGIIKKSLKIPNFQHIMPLDKPSKAKLLIYFAKSFDRMDIKILPVKAPKVVDRTLQTNNPAKNLLIWRAAGYKEPPTVKKMIEELKQFSESE